uniref:Uncharacterized protein n=1 Tax=Rhizophora mucronata TaxID=61149 RepID=A0A2P2IY86_RHIMU
MINVGCQLPPTVFGLKYVTKDNYSIKMPRK